MLPPSTRSGKVTSHLNSGEPNDPAFEAQSCSAETVGLELTAGPMCEPEELLRLGPSTPRTQPNTKSGSGAVILLDSVQASKLPVITTHRKMRMFGSKDCMVLATVMILGASAAVAAVSCDDGGRLSV